MAKETVLLSISTNELESLIIGCINSVIKYHAKDLKEEIRKEVSRLELERCKPEIENNNEREFSNK